MPCATPPAAGNFDVLDTYMDDEVVAFRTRFMTSPSLLALSEHLYHREWRGFFQRRWTDRAVYMAFACYALRLPRSLESPAVLDLSHLRGNSGANVRSTGRRGGGAPGGGPGSGAPTSSSGELEAASRATFRRAVPSSISGTIQSSTATEETNPSVENASSVGVPINSWSAVVPEASEGKRVDGRVDEVDNHTMQRHTQSGGGPGKANGRRETRVHRAARASALPKSVAGQSNPALSVMGQAASLTALQQAAPVAVGPYRSASSEALWRAFEYFDGDQDGRISLDEATQVLRVLGVQLRRADGAAGSAATSSQTTGFDERADYENSYAYQPLPV